MRHIILWKWRPHSDFRGPDYSAEHVNVMAAMLQRNIRRDFRVVCVTDEPAGITECETFALWPDAGNVVNATKRTLPSCYRRLKIYDRATQEEMGIEVGERIISLDLDAVITGDLGEVLSTPGRFVGWGLTGEGGRKVCNGSFQMFDAGDLTHIWDEFDPMRSPKAAAEAGYKGSDQAWLSWRLAEWEHTVRLEWPALASYPLQNRIQGLLSRENRIIFFHGQVKPWDPIALQESAWITRYWRR